MVKIAIQVPNFLFLDTGKSFTGYDAEFAKEFGHVLYLPGLRHRLRRGSGYKALLRASGIDPDRFDFAFSVRELSRKSDILVCFNGVPHIKQNIPPRRFSGLKVWHIMDYVFGAPLANKVLESSGVDALMGYCDHGRHSAFFRSVYPRYATRVIPVPFGFAPRFESVTPFRKRIPKVIALGSVNPLDEAGIPEEANVRAYVRFYPQQRWTHRWRRMLVEHQADLVDLMDSQLPSFPQTKNPDYDAVATLNQYAMFANDEGLMAFPPARTYEGVAAGAVMVANDHPCYREFGFQDGVNCVLHDSHSVANFRDKVAWYLERPDELQRVAAAGTAMVRERYSHPAVARGIAHRLQALFAGNTAAAFQDWSLDAPPVGGSGTPQTLAAATSVRTHT